MTENFQFSAVCLASRQVTSSPLPPTPAPPAPTPTTLPSGEQYPGHRRHMRTRPYCFALLLPCTGVRIAQAYWRKRPTMFVAGGVCIPGMFLYVGTVYHAVQATVYKQNSCYFLVFRANEYAKRAWRSALYLPPSSMHGWLFSLALPFPVRLPEKREKITPVLWDRFIYFFYLFTSFSGHRPAQRECARRGLIGPKQSAIPIQSHNP